MTGALFDSAMDDTIKNLIARFIKTARKRGIFHAKQGLANKAPEHYRKIMGQEPLAETARKDTLGKETDFNHAKVDSKSDVLRSAIENLDPVDILNTPLDINKCKSFRKQLLLVEASRPRVAENQRLQPNQNS